MTLQPANTAEPRRKVERPWAPLSIPAYRSFWLAGLFSNLGTWMHETGAQWMMTTMEPSPEMVSAVRTVMAIPVFCLALPAGVWADRFNRRHWLLTTQLTLLCIASLMALLAMLGWLTPGSLLLLTALMGIGMILNQPAWQALTPELVPAAMIPSAVQAGSVSFNLARSLGPAAAGLLIAQFGVAATFLFNAMSFLGVIAVLIAWRPNLEPPEHRASADFLSELKKGIFVVGTSSVIRNVLIRVFIFTFSASILWSLLALVATTRLGLAERGFGVSLALIGTGAVAGVWFLPWMRSKFSSEAIVLGAQGVYAIICMLIGSTSLPWLVMPSLLIIGACWMSSMTTLNATAQVFLPKKFRARGMSAYMMSFAFGMAAGSAVWGWLAWATDLGVAFWIAGLMLLCTSLAAHPLKIGNLFASNPP
jgi:MFS family permease